MAIWQNKAAWIRWDIFFEKFFKITLEKTKDIAIFLSIIMQMQTEIFLVHFVRHIYILRGKVCPVTYVHVKCPLILRDHLHNVFLHKSVSAEYPHTPPRLPQALIFPIYSMRVSCQPECWWFCSVYTAINIRCFAKLKWSWLRMFELVLWPTWRLNFRSIWVVQAFEMTRRCVLVCRKVTWKANVVNFDENVSYSSTLMSLYERNEQLLMNETAIECKTNMDIIVLYCNFIFII